MSFREKGQPGLNNSAAIAVYSVDEKDDAMGIIVTLGKCQYTPHPNSPVPGTGNVWYRLADFSGDVHDLPEITSRINDVYERILQGKRVRVNRNARIKSTPAK